MSKRLIYLEDAITVLQRCYCGIELKRKCPVTENERFFYFDVLQGLEDLPSAQPEDIARDIATIIENEKDMRVMLQQQWIPCDETVEIPDHEVLACDKYGEEILGYLVYADDQWICESDSEVMYDTIAWMEKPEPYQKGGE